jgi:5-formyltetrahydrofolate cyclo-ligase
MAPQPQSPSFPLDSHANAKARLRAQYRQTRTDLGGTYRDQASEQICERIREWAAFPPSGIVFTYLPMRGEVDLRPLIAAAPHLRWAIPRVVDSPAPHLVFHEYKPEQLVPHRYGMLEPKAALPVVEPEHAELILVPGLAFTRQGFRLGYGGGYYDRLLSAPEHAPTLGTCFQALLLEEIPHEPHDVPVDFLVTERLGVIETQGV